VAQRALRAHLVYSNHRRDKAGMTFRMQYPGHGDLIPDVIDTVRRLHADDGLKRIVLAREGAASVSHTLSDTDGDLGGKIIDALAEIELLEHDVDLIVFHTADGVQRVLGWRLYANLVVEILPVARLDTMVPKALPGQYRSLAERRLDLSTC